MRSGDRVGDCHGSNGDPIDDAETDAGTHLESWSSHVFVWRYGVAQDAQIHGQDTKAGQISSSCVKRDDVSGVALARVD